MNILSKRDTTRVLNVLEKCIHIPPDMLNPEALADKPLTGNLIKCSAVDLVYILLEVEKEFGIRIPPERLTSISLVPLKKSVPQWLILFRKRTCNT